MSSSFSQELYACLSRAPGRPVSASPARKRRRLDSPSGGGDSVSVPASPIRAPAAAAAAIAPPAAAAAAAPPVANIWDALGDGGADDDDGVVNESTTDETQQKVFSSLDLAAKDAIDRRIDMLLNGRERQHTCFFCNMVVRHENEVRRMAGQATPLIEGAYGYKLAIDFVTNNPHLSVLQKAEGITDIYTRHVYNPCLKLSGGRPPADMPPPSLRGMLEHLLLYNFDPVAMNMDALQTMHNLVLAYSAKLVVDGQPTESGGRIIISATESFSRLLDKQVKLLGGKVTTPFALDPHKLMTVTGTGPLDAFRAQAANILGGATATNSNDVVTGLTARRPNFGGHAVPRVYIEDDNDNDESQSQSQSQSQQ